MITTHQSAVGVRRLRATTSRTSRQRRASRLAAAIALIGLAGFGAVAPSPAMALTGTAGAVAVVNGTSGNGYAIVSADGGQYNYGGSRFTGSLAGQELAAPIVGAARVPGSEAKWFVAADGGVFTEGAAGFYGSMGGQPLNQPIAAIVASPSGRGYLLVARDGGTFAFGDFAYPGSLADLQLNAPIVAAASTPDGRGVWLVASDGGVFTLGSAGFFGSMGGKSLNAPVVAVLASSTGGGYLLVGRDGGTFTFGDFPFPGSLSGIALNAPIVAAAPYGRTGVWLLGADGGVFALNAPYYGNATGEGNAKPAPLGEVVASPSLVSVPCPHGGSIQVSATLGSPLSRLLAAADQAGHAVCGSGYRSSARQIELRKTNCGTSKYAIYQMPSSKCSPPTARPGTSRHERGLAVDFKADTSGYAWLADNASKFGLHLLVGGSERWHFSTDGH